MTTQSMVLSWLIVDKTIIASADTYSWKSLIVLLSFANGPKVGRSIGKSTPLGDQIDSTE